MLYFSMRIVVILHCTPIALHREDQASFPFDLRLSLNSEYFPIFLSNFFFSLLFLSFCNNL